MQIDYWWHNNKTKTNVHSSINWKYSEPINDDNVMFGVMIFEENNVVEDMYYYYILLWLSHYY